MPLISLILPIGLSFHTFQAMSYTIEVYRGNQSAERHLGIYSLYVLFYPQMVAGPIERPQHILHQFYKKINFDNKTFFSGLFLMSIGFFKKVVIADRLGLYVDPVFSDSHHHSGLDLLIGTYFFAFQIYCDFSGYSDIAIGAALTLGIQLMQNFNTPYLSKNIPEFWKRWHISLSTWFRDYVYIPLGGNRKGFYFTCINLLIVFLLSGLWHGADWKYVVWGAIHGIFLIGYQLLNKYNVTIKTYRPINLIFTFNLVCLAWIFFRAKSVVDATYILTKIFSGSYVYTAASTMLTPEIFYCATLILILLGGERYLKKHQFAISTKLAVTAVLIIACYLFGVFNESQFIYFQF
ncbi:MBOAT family O-acyltransferase [Mucilaginibacter pallidiroseus]|nr:MBOAT family O-acyltransferase [Mucilaginibacter pallidiroseus]